MKNSRWWLCSLLILFPFLFPGECALSLPQEVAPPEKLLAMADEMVPVVARLRGLEPKASIKKGIESRQEISRSLEELVNDQYEKAELRASGILLQKIGFLPPALDYAAFVVKLLTEQVGGYYDPEKKTLFLAGWLSADQQKPVMAHELTHALQDQYFDLGAMLKRDRRSHNDDLTLAHQAFVEGDATAVMLDFLLQPAGRSFVELPDLAFVMRMQMSLMDSQFEVLRSAPEYVKETLLFPYGYGTAFLQKVRAQQAPWAAVDRIYSDMPSSTEQILHPDKFLGQRDNPKPVEIEDPTPNLGKDWKVTYRNVLGEFSLFLLLKLALTEEVARGAASGWGGDQVILIEEGGSKRSAAFVDTVWDTQESADRFYGALVNWLQRRYPQAHKVEEGENALAVTAGGEFHAVRRKVGRISLILGVPESFAAKFSGR